MAAKDTKSSGDCAAKACALKPINKTTIINYYSPIIGAASYSFLSVNVLNPSLAVGFISKRDLTNVLLCGSLLGTGSYIYSRPHLQGTTQQARLFYAGFGSVVFTFSSVLLWAVLRSVLPNNVVIGSVAGLASCYALGKGGQSYLKFVDSQVAKQ